MSLFDDLCKTVESLHTSNPTNLAGAVLRHQLSAAARFVLERPAEDYQLEDPDLPFHLPFPCMTIEDNAGCVAVFGLSEDGDKPDPTQIGMFLTFSNLRMEDIPFQSGWVVFHLSNLDTRAFDLRIVSTGVLNKDGSIRVIKSRPDFPVTDLSQIAVETVHKILFISQPSRFVMEVTPRKCRDPKTSRLIPRAHERPFFTVLTPGEIKKRYIRDPAIQTTGVTKAPHSRRGHFRTFTAERYRDAKGKRVWVNACWVGPTEATVGNKHYRVRLDL